MLVLGFDYGSRKTGVAVGQTLTRQASPLTTLAMVQQRPDWDAIQRLIGEWKPDALVVGLPFNMDDTPTALTERIRRFGRQLEGRYRLPVHLADERLTSRIACAEYGDRLDRSGGIDAFAAKLIIETWLSEYDG
ncbi:MAG: Holliday junction resolvase RuvX [Gammaproteobacteria bacterium]|nr:Holliday junction resolvase RuvX [Gammaproteobacteria bacterium]MBU1654862.1 Holliday junction resolvase RuvX [Gammaproteobacteria bacterium]MBU1961153.1 Holliday junction resolvase RuvX [Gammaproteobacteria bacterium]